MAIKVNFHATQTRIGEAKIKIFYDISGLEYDDWVEFAIVSPRGRETSRTVRYNVTGDEMIIDVRQFGWFRIIAIPSRGQDSKPFTIMVTPSRIGQTTYSEEYVLTKAQEKSIDLGNALTTYLVFRSLGSIVKAKVKIKKFEISIVDVLGIIAAAITNNRGRYKESPRAGWKYYTALTHDGKKVTYRAIVLDEKGNLKSDKVVREETFETF